MLVELGRVSSIQLLCLSKLDTDECQNKETNKCHANSACTNTEGSYDCRCQTGYKGDGTNCTGNMLLLQERYLEPTLCISHITSLNASRVANPLVN